MTQSHALAVSHRKVWVLAGPIILSNISVPFVGVVDTAVVGHLPNPQALGAVALGALIFSFIYWGFGFLRMGTTGFIAQAYGAQDLQALSDTLLRVMLLATALGLLIIACGRPLIDLALWIIDSSEAVEGLTADYANIRIWSAPATLCLYAFTGVFIGMQNTRAALWLQLVLNVTNILLDVVFVVGFDWGVKGVAWASLIAEYVALATGFLLLRKPLRDALQQFNRERLLQREAVYALITANTDIFMRTLCLLFAFGYFTAQGALMGEVILAANAILLHLQSVAAYALDGFAHAVEAMAGSACGARHRRAFRLAVRLTTMWSGLVGAVISLIYFFMREEIINWFTSIDTVAATALEYLPWMIAAPLLSVWSFQLDGIFIGTSQTREMRNAMAISLIIYLLLLQVLVPVYGNHGLFMGLLAFMLIRAVTLLFYFPRIEARLTSLVR